MESITPIMVSISCITYNHAPYIRQCLDGFIMQKASFAFEVLIHDDCSTDGTTEIIKEYETKYPDIIKPLYEIENQYQQGKPSGSAVWNFPRAKGKYIAICEGDDYWIDPYKLQKQVDFLEANPEYSMCFHNAFVYEIDRDRNVLAHLFNSYSSDRDLTQEDAICNWVVPTASMLVRRQLIQPLEGLVKIYSGDYALILSLYSRGKIRYLNTISSVYRHSLVGGSASATHNWIFVMSQHVTLLESYNEVTDCKYNTIVQARVNDLKQDIKFQTLKTKYGLLIALIVMPWYSSLKVMQKIQLIRKAVRG